MKFFKNKKTEYSSGDVKVTEITLDETPETTESESEEKSLPEAFCEPQNEAPEDAATEKVLPDETPENMSQAEMTEPNEQQAEYAYNDAAAPEIAPETADSAESEAKDEEPAPESELQKSAAVQEDFGSYGETDLQNELARENSLATELETEDEIFLNRIKAERDTDNERAAHVYAETAEKVEEAGKARYAGSSEEKKAARVIRDLFEDKLGEYARMEPFDVRPFSTVQGLPVFAAISFVVFLLSCIWSPLGVLLFPTVAAMIVSQVIKNKNDFSKLFPKRTSYNVVSVIEHGEKRIDKTVVLGCHYDTDYGRMELPKWISKQNSPGFHTFMTWYAVASNLLLTVLSVVCIFLKPGPKAIVMFVGFVALAVGIVYMATYVTYFKLGARMNKNALSGLGLTLSVAQHLKLNAEEIPSDVRVVVAAFGSSYAGAKGSEAFLEEHYGKDNLLINPVFIDLCALRKNDVNVVVSDKNLKLNYGGHLAETAFETLKEYQLNVDKVVEQGRFADATSWAKRGVPSVFLDGGIKKESLFGETESEIETRYCAVLNLVRRVIRE